MSREYHLLSPLVAGEFGEESVFNEYPDGSGYDVVKVHFVFEDELEDCLFCNMTTYAGTKELADRLREIKATGIKFDEITVSKEGDFELPDIEWFRITGKAGKDDFGLHDGPPDKGIVVSSRVWDIIQELGVTYCLNFDYPPDKEAKWQNTEDLAKHYGIIKPKKDNQ